VLDNYGIKLEVWGDYACFTRPEMKTERVTYDVISPSAARGILDAIYWKPSIFWVIDALHVLKPIKFDNVRRNELSKRLPVGSIRKGMRNDSVPVEIIIEEERQPRATLLLRDVAYVIEAHFEFTSREDDIPAKHRSIFERRARKGQCYHRPYLGCREFAANFRWLEGGIPKSSYVGNKDLGWMLFDIDFESPDLDAMFYRATMHNGIIDVPPRHAGEVKM